MGKSDIRRIKAEIVKSFSFSVPHSLETHLKPAKLVPWTSNLISFETCLIDAYSNEFYHPTQEKRFVWAVEEAVDRLGKWGVGWTFRPAVKSHKCVRNCKINPKEYYVAFRSEADFIPMKLCFRCASMILEFMGIARAPVAQFSHWSPEREEPVNASEIKNGDGSNDTSFK